MNRNYNFRFWRKKKKGNEKELRLALFMYKSREKVKELYGDAYAKKMEPYMDIVIQVIAANSTTPLDALARISEVGIYKKAGVLGQCAFVAATLDILEAKHKDQQEWAEELRKLRAEGRL